MNSTSLLLVRQARREETLKQKKIRVKLSSTGNTWRRERKDKESASLSLGLIGLFSRLLLLLDEQREKRCGSKKTSELMFSRFTEVLTVAMATSESRACTGGILLRGIILHCHQETNKSGLMLM